MEGRYLGLGLSLDSRVMPTGPDLWGWGFAPRTRVTLPNRGARLEDLNPGVLIEQKVKP